MESSESPQFTPTSMPEPDKTQATETAGAGATTTAPKDLADLATTPASECSSNDRTLPEQSDLWRETLGWQPSEAEQQKLQDLYEGIIEGNKKLNLTRLTEPNEFWEKHLWDSLRALRPWLRDELPLGKPDQTAKIIDIGTGGGFPGIPAAIVFPEAQVTLLDSTRKKMVFLQQLIGEMQLPNIGTVTERAEASGQQVAHRGRYDLALIRAVGPVTVCAEYCLPMVRYGGMAVLYRGQWSVEEAEAIAETVHLLGAEVIDIEAFETPLSRGTRHCVYLKKIAGTPDMFPRPVGVPVQSPLP